MAGGVPVVDVAPLADGAADTSAKAAVAAAVRAACIEWGFFYVKNAVPQAQVDSVLAAARRLFDLPLADKRALAALLSPLHRGWTGVGGAHNCSPGDGEGPDLKESFLLGAEGSASPMHGPNPWPPEALLPGWHAAVASYFSALVAASRVVSRGVALALGLPESFFEERMKDPVAQLLLLQYPPPPAGAGGSGSGGGAGARMGCGAHTDCGFLTILAQDDVPGLEVLSLGGRGGGQPGAGGGEACRQPSGGDGGSSGEGGEKGCGRGASSGGEGEWVKAPPLPGALLVNLGDLAQFWSGGLFRSTPHRVYIDAAAAGRPRHSVPFFCNCDFDAAVVPLAHAGGSGGGGGGVPGADGADGATTAGRYIMRKLGLMYEEENE